MSQSRVLAALAEITEELKNFEGIARAMTPAPGDKPTLDGIDISGEVIPLNGIVGGDHLIYMDFKKRYDLDARIGKARAEGRSDVVENLETCREMAGITVIDVAGHQTTDAMLAGMVHQAFLMGALYELELYGKITGKLFENLNTRLYRSSIVSKFVTAIYGEVSTHGRFSFLSAAHPVPLLFSAKNEGFVDIKERPLNIFPPLGTIPSEVDIDRGKAPSSLGLKSRYEMNELIIEPGEILLLSTDGLTDHSRDDESYVPGRLEKVVGKSRDGTAVEIVEAIKADLYDFADPSDDLTLVAIKRN